MNISKEKLELAMSDACMSSSQLSQNSHVRQETIARIKNGANTTPATVGKIAKALGVNAKDLIKTDAATSGD